MNALIKTETQLPATIEELHDWILIGKERLKVHQAKIRAIEKVGMAEDARKAALQDGQDAGTAVIYAEAKPGELLANRPRNYQSSGRGTLKETPLPSGISKATSHERLCDVCWRDGKYVMGIVARYEEGGKVVAVAPLPVVQYRFHGKWVFPKKTVTVRQMVDEARKHLNNPKIIAA